MICFLGADHRRKAQIHDRDQNQQNNVGGGESPPS
jgi:hypothetical protein